MLDDRQAGAEPGNSGPCRRSNRSERASRRAARRTAPSSRTKYAGPSRHAAPSPNSIRRARAGSELPGVPEKVFEELVEEVRVSRSLQAGWITLRPAGRGSLRGSAAATDRPRRQSMIFRRTSGAKVDQLHQGVEQLRHGPVASCMRRRSLALPAQTRGMLVQQYLARSLPRSSRAPAGRGGGIGDEAASSRYAVLEASKALALLDDVCRAHPCSSYEAAREARSSESDGPRLVHRRMAPAGVEHAGARQVRVAEAPRSVWAEQLDGRHADGDAQVHRPRVGGQHGARVTTPPRTRAAAVRARRRRPRDRQIFHRARARPARP